MPSVLTILATTVFIYVDVLLLLLLLLLLLNNGFMNMQSLKHFQLRLFFINGSMLENYNKNIRKSTKNNNNYIKKECNVNR